MFASAAGSASASATFRYIADDRVVSIVKCK